MAWQVKLVIKYDRTEAFRLWNSKAVIAKCGLIILIAGFQANDCLNCVTKLILECVTII